MDTRSIEIMPGSEMWFEGELVEVRELRADSILIATGTEMRAIATRDFVAHATPLGNHDREPQLLQQPTNVVLSALTTKQREAVETKMRAVRAVLEAAEDQEISVRHACDSMAHELGIPTRTLQRWVSAFRDAGEAGLVSSRDLGRYQSSVDARWDDACLAVLREYISSSTPTKDLVIDRTARLLDEQYGTGIVPIPWRSASGVLGSALYVTIDSPSSPGSCHPVLTELRAPCRQFADQSGELLIQRITADLEPEHGRGHAARFGPVRLERAGSGVEEHRTGDLRVGVGTPTDDRPRHAG